MSYAVINDMVLRFGAAEMIRASTPDGQPAVAIVDAPIEMALEDASALIDTYLRKRYQVPLDVAPAEVRRACCILARYDLATGGERNPSEQVQKSRDEVVIWLGRIAKGEAVLDVTQVAPGQESFSAMQSRTQIYQDQDPVCGAYPACDDFGIADDSGGGFAFGGGAL